MHIIISDLKKKTFTQILSHSLPSASHHPGEKKTTKQKDLR
jgi:hypothetical protein